MGLSSFLSEKTLIRAEETGKFYMLFLTSFFLGLFVAFYFVSANSVFVAHFDVNFLPVAYIIAGLFGYAISSLYSYLQQKMPSQKLFVYAVAFMAIVALVARIALPWIPEKWLSLFVFIWAWPFISLVSTIIGGLSICYLDLLQVKRLFGLVNTGGVLAAILGYLIVPVLLRWLSHTYDLLIIGQLGTIGAILILILLHRRFKMSNVKEIGDDANENSLGFLALFKNDYYRYIIITAAFSMLAIYLTDFGFLAGIKVQDELFSNAAEVSRFMALIFGGLKIGEFLISYTSNRFIARYGVGFGLSILPLVSLLLMILAATSAFVLGEASILFFSLLVANKMLERILRRGLDEPSFNVLYQPLPSNVKLAIQTKVAVVMQTAIAIAGILLFVGTRLVSISGQYNLFYYSVFYIPVLGLWLYFARKLYLAYKYKIHNILEDKKLFKIKAIDEDIFGTDLLTRQLYNENLKAVKMSVVILAETNPKALEAYIPLLFHYNDSVINRAILKSIDFTYPQSLRDLVKMQVSQSQDKLIADLAKTALANWEYDATIKITDDELSRLSRSSDFKDNYRALQHIFFNDNEDYYVHLPSLMESPDEAIRKITYNVIASKNSEKLSLSLVNMLVRDDAYHFVADILIKAGDSGVSGLNALFYDRRSSVQLLQKVVEILAKIGTEESSNVLFEQLQYDDPTIKRRILEALHAMEYQVSENHKGSIKGIIIKRIKDLAWLLIIRAEFFNDRVGVRIVPALDLERKMLLEELFQYLALIYNVETIELIKTNIKGENTIYALEIIDNFLAPDIKDLLIPVFEDNTLNQRVKKLYSVFDVARLKVDARLKEMIRSDKFTISSTLRAKAITLLARIHKTHKFNRWRIDIGRYKDIDWTKEEMQRVLQDIHRSDMPDEIFMALFHKEELVYSSAAKAIYDENPARCFDYLKGFDNYKKQLMHSLANDDQDNSGLILERIRLLKRIEIYDEMPDNMVVKIALLVRLQDVRKGQKVSIYNKDNQEDVLLISKGSLRSIHNDDHLLLRKNDIIIRGLNVNIAVNQLYAESNSLLIRLNRKEYFNMLVNEVELIEYMFKRF